MKPSEFTVGRSHGTSYATATTAGVAALWLAFHGRQNLVSKYGESNIPAVFKELLRSRGFNAPNGWDTEDFGPGILDAHRLLSAPLPNSPRARGMRSLAAPANGMDELMMHLPGVSAAKARQGIKRLLDVPEKNIERALSEVGGELGFHLAHNPSARNAFLSTPRGTSAKSKARALRKSMSGCLKRCASKRLKSVIANG